MKRECLARVTAESMRAMLLAMVVLLAAGCDAMQTDFVLRVIDADGAPKRELLQARDGRGEIIPSRP